MGTCSLMGALYGCETSSFCRKGIYCECNEVYHVQQRDVPAKNFQNLPLDELWKYRFQQTPESKALLTQIINDDEKSDYVNTLLSDPHITGDDVKYLLGDEYPQLSPQLQKLVVNPHGLKSELAINGELEYDNMGEYFSDLFQRIKEKVSEKIQSVKSKRRILELIKKIDNKEDLQYILRQILLSGDDKLYNFVSSYLERSGRSIEEESLYQPRRRFGRRRRGCQKRKRCGRGRSGGTDYDSPPGGVWHGRPLKRKIVIIHNDATIKIEADEDEVIEIGLINELKKAEEKAGAAAPGPGASMKQQQVIPPPLDMASTNQEIPIPATPQGNTYMQGMIPGQGNIFMQGTIPSQGNTNMQSMMGPWENISKVPLMQDKAELYSMVPPEMNQYATPTMSTPMQGNNFMQETFRPQIPVLPDLQESYSITKPVNSITLTKPSNILQQESLAPMITNVPQVPTMQQIQHEIITPPQMRPISLELSPPTTSQYNSFMTDSMPSVSLTNTAPPIHRMEEILTPPPQMKPTPLQTPASSSSGYSVMQEVMAPISINTPMVPTMYSKEDISVSPPQMRPSPLNSQNNFHIQETMAPVLTSSTVQPLMHQIEQELLQPPHMKPVANEVPFSSYNTLIKETLPSMTPGTNSPQTVYEYINSAQNMPPLNFDLENSTPSSMSSSNYNFEGMIPPKMSSLNDLEDTSPPSMSSLTYNFETPSNMANQLGSQFQNALSNFPSSSLTSYTNEIGLPQNGYTFQTSSLPSGLNTSNMEWMSAPSTFSTISSNMGSMIPHPSWLATQTSNVNPHVNPQDDNLLKASTNNGLTGLQENVSSFKESIPSSQTINNSLIHEDTPRYIQQSLSAGNSDEESRSNKIQKISESGFSSSQNIKNEIEEVADNFTTNTIQQASKMLPSEQNVESNVVSMQQGIAQSIPDPKKKKKSLFYMVIDDTGNVVHSASVDHEEEREKQAATQTTSTFPYIQNYFSQVAPNGESKPPNYGWPYWSK